MTTDNKIVLDVSAEEAKEARWRPSTDTAGGAESFSDSAKVEKGALELERSAAHHACPLARNQRGPEVVYQPVLWQPAFLKQ